ncbi:hypothetical protein T4E_7674 [Trichinella pseudospiralis]|uniref:Uncharacterized protein n=1 Tax=Trichinella pseudospiralis TaxID=6337 RepID=A0A0V0XW93_TRIPS|nr:hypothetical protein T4E_7674 [Trichinella pseudospiralis]
MDLRKLNLGTNLDIQFIPDEVDFVEKKWRRDQTEKHTENAQTGGQNGHRLDEREPLLHLGFTNAHLQLAFHF